MRCIPEFLGCPVFPDFHVFADYLDTPEFLGCFIFPDFHEFPDFLGTPEFPRCPVSHERESFGMVI